MKNKVFLRLLILFLIISIMIVAGTACGGKDDEKELLALLKISACNKVISYYTNYGFDATEFIDSINNAKSEDEITEILATINDAYIIWSERFEETTTISSEIESTSNNTTDMTSTESSSETAPPETFMTSTTTVNIDTSIVSDTTTETTSTIESTVSNETTTFETTADIETAVEAAS